MRIALASAIALAALSAPAFAQDDATIRTADSDRFGTHLVTGDGRPVYLFTADTQGRDGQDASIACTGECLDAWPLVTATGTPQAGEGVQDDMLGTQQQAGQSVVTYNGWPLYHFARDEGTDTPQGQEVEAFGGEWYLVTAEGEKAGD